MNLFRKVVGVAYIAIMVFGATYLLLEPSQFAGIAAMLNSFVSVIYFSEQLK